MTVETVLLHLKTLTNSHFHFLISCRIDDLGLWFVGSRKISSFNRDAWTPVFGELDRTVR
jgi:hypothetical protein